MSLYDRIFGKKDNPKKVIQGDAVFQTLTAYKPVFTTWNGALYESELVRAAVDARARHISKLKVELLGSARPKMRNRLKHRPNQFQTWSQFLYRASTILDMCNTLCIVPVVDEYGDTCGFFPVLPTRCELREYNGVVYLRYEFRNGQIAAIEYDRCAVMTKFQYKDDFFGENNSALNETMSLVHIQNQGIEEAVKNSATYRFTAQLNNFATDDDLIKERKAFSEQNLSAEAEASGGLLLFPNNYKDIKQIENKPYTVDHEQMQLIKTNVFNYFGVNEDILQNKAFGDSWSAFYEGCVEVFAIQFSEVMTKALFTEKEQSNGSEVMATANRLQYMSNQDKLNVTSQLADRGLISINEAREIWNLPPVDGGDIRMIRGEYYNSDEKTASVDEEKEGNDAD